MGKYKTVFAIFIFVFLFANYGFAAMSFTFDVNSTGPIKTIANGISEMPARVSELVKLAFQFSESANYGTHQALLNLVADESEIAMGGNVLWRRSYHVNKTGMISLKDYLEKAGYAVEKMFKGLTVGARIKPGQDRRWLGRAFEEEARKTGLLSEVRVGTSPDSGSGKKVAVEVVEDGAKEIGWLSKSAKAGGHVLKKIAWPLTGASVLYAGWDSWQNDGSGLKAIGAGAKELIQPIPDVYDYFKEKAQGAAK